MDNLGTAVISAFIGAVVSAIGAVIQNVLAARSKIDESLRADRIAVYKVLWQKTELIPLWPRATDVTYERLNTFSAELRHWYFTEGGLFLSTQAREAYGALQTSLSDVIEIATGRGQEVITEADYGTIQARCSALRTELTNDLLSRQRAQFL
jgi:hypothetical protein